VTAQANKLTSEGTADACHIFRRGSGKRFVQAQHVESTGSISEAENVICSLDINRDSRGSKSGRPCPCDRLGAAQNSTDKIKNYCGGWRVRLQGAAR
jgi:hypothetical protein